MSDHPAQFTDRLLEELLPLVGTTTPTAVPPSRTRYELAGRTPRRGPSRRLALLASALVLVTGVAVAAAALWPRNAAYAVEPRPDGSVVVTIKNLSDPEGLQAMLATDNVPATVLVVKDGQRCAPLRAIRAPGAIVGQPGTANVITIHPEALPPGSRAVLGLSELGDQGVVTLFAVVAGPAPSCFPGSAPVPAPR